MEKTKYEQAVEIIERLEQRDYEENENKLLAYKNSSARYELLKELVDAGLLK